MSRHLRKGQADTRMTRRSAMRSAGGTSPFPRPPRCHPLPCIPALLQPPQLSAQGLALTPLEG
eukprot:4551993-Prymnesium_polylepis.1